MRVDSQRRPAIATIEFVMVWPMLLMMCAGIFLAARASVAKEAAATHARRTTFAARKTGNPGEIFLLTHDPLESKIHGSALIRATPGPLFRGALFEGESHGFTLDRTWDYRDVPFDPVGDWKIHPEPFKKIARNVPGVGEVMVGGINLTLWALNPTKNPALVLAALLGRIANPIVRVTGAVLNGVMSAVLFPARIAAKVAAALLPWWSSKKRKLNRVVGLIDILGTAVENLDKASQGKPVSGIGGLGRLRKP